MLRKLYSTVSGACSADNPDSPQHQEVLLPGSLYSMIIKERMEEILNNIRTNIVIDVRNGVAVDFNDSEYSVSVREFCLRLARALFYQGDLTSKFRHWLKTFQLPRYWKPCVANWLRPPTGVWFHYHRGKAELAALYQPL